MGDNTVNLTITTTAIVTREDMRNLHLLVVETMTTTKTIMGIIMDQLMKKRKSCIPEWWSREKWSASSPTVPLLISKTPNCSIGTRDSVISVKWQIIESKMSRIY
jgi:hypothetical protein